MLITDNNLINVEKFIINNSKKTIKFNNRFCIDSRKTQSGQIFISVDSVITLFRKPEYIINGFMVDPGSIKS